MSATTIIRGVVIMIVPIKEVTEEVTTVARMITEVRIITKASLGRHKEEAEKPPSSTREKEVSSINIWVRMPLPIWVMTFQQTQTTLRFASMGLPMKNVPSQVVVQP